MRLKDSSVLFTFSHGSFVRGPCFQLEVFNSFYHFLCLKSLKLRICVTFWTKSWLDQITDGHGTDKRRQSCSFGLLFIGLMFQNANWIQRYLKNKWMDKEIDVYEYVLCDILKHLTGENISSHNIIHQELETSTAWDNK